MLEHAALWIGPSPGGEARRLIRDSASQQLLGVCKHRPSSARWFRWLSWPTLEICETADEALLFTIERYWGLRPTWVVRDADERQIGWLRGGGAWDAYGRLIGRQASAGRWLSEEGQEVATIQPDGDALMLSYRCDNNPYARMLLLAAALR
jgi:hypothetical protein